MADTDYKKMSVEELEHILAKYRPGDTPFGAAASYELQRRYLEKAVHQISKPHWTLTPAFWVAVAAMLFAAIAAFPVIQGWLLSSPPVSKAASSQQQQSQSKLPLPTEAKTLPPAPSRTKP
jgi:hypothetical protein